MHTQAIHVVPSIDELYDLTVVVDKYDCRLLAHGAFKSWMAQHKTGRDLDLYKQLAMASTLQELKAFEKLTFDMAWSGNSVNDIGVIDDLEDLGLCFQHEALCRPNSSGRNLLTHPDRPRDQQPGDRGEGCDRRHGPCPCRRQSLPSIRNAYRLPLP